MLSFREHMHQLVIAAAVFGICSSSGLEWNCTRDGMISCYTCMGRDMENCMTGQTCCRGACFKLEDEAHNVLVKGCSPVREEDGSMKRRELNVKLYWAEGAKVSGKSYFCTGKEYCNEVGQLVPSVLTIFGLFTLRNFF